MGYLQKEKKLFTNITPIIFLILFTIIIFLWIFIHEISKSEPKTVHIGIAKSQYIQNINTNYYKLWLEKQSGLKIEFVNFPNNYTSEYLDIMFGSNNSIIDGFFSNTNEEGTILTNSVLEDYGKKGYILPLNQYMNHSKVMNQLYSEFDAYNIKKVMTCSDGNIYYMPGLDDSFSQKYAQVLWINQSWLKNLGLQIPKTTEELRHVLKAFLDKDPNQNGKKDEIPLVGCYDSYSEQSYHFMMNAFTYCDPKNSYMYVLNGSVKFAPITKEWRSAMEYLHDLYKEGLLSSMQFTLNKKQLVQLVNDKRNLVGAFTSASISEVALQNSPEVVSNYICVKPIAGKDGTQYATVNTPLPSPNGVITANCKYPEEVFHLYELMLSKEAFLIGRFGEEGVDWEYAKTGDIDIKGKPATIRIINYIENKIQNKTLLEAGPFLTYTKYSDGVTWNGYEADQEYMNARAYSSYSSYFPKEYIKTIMFDDRDKDELVELRATIDEYTNKMLSGFIRGDYNPYSDEVWKGYLEGYQNLGIDTYLKAVKKSYNELKE